MLSTMQIAQRIHQAIEPQQNWSSLPDYMQEAYVATAIAMLAHRNQGFNSFQIAQEGHRALTKYAATKGVVIGAWSSTREAWLKAADDVDGIVGTVL